MLVVLKFIFFSNYKAKVTLFVNISLSLVLKKFSITLKKAKKRKKNYPLCIDTSFCC